MFEPSRIVALQMNQCGNTPLGDNIIKRALVKCIPREVVKPFGIALRDGRDIPASAQVHDETDA